jgi:hypothetical protein
MILTTIDLTALGAARDTRRDGGVNRHTAHAARRNIAQVDPIPGLTDIPAAE